MKIALCFSGQIRTGNLLDKYIKNFLGEVLDFSDIFVHTWNIRTETSSDIDLAQQRFFEKPIIFEKFEELYKPKKMVVQNFENKRGGTPLFETLYESNELRKQYQKENKVDYDFIVKIRPDIIYNRNHYLIDELNEIVNDDSDNTLYTNDFFEASTRKKVEDVFWIARPKVFDIMANFMFYRLENTTVDDYQEQMFEYLGENNLKLKPLFKYNETNVIRVSNILSGVNVTDKIFLDSVYL